MSMASLLEAPAAPFVRKMGFFNVAFDTARAGVRDWLEQTKGRQGHTVTDQALSGPLEEVLRSLLPLTMPDIERRLLITTDGAWTAYFDNLQSGTDRSAIGALSRRMRCDAVHFVARREAIVLTVYGAQPTSTGSNTIRDLRAFRDMSGWEFQQSGTPLPFEDTSAYRSAQVEARFTLDLLERYLRAMGIRAFQWDFYRPSAACLIATRKNAS